MIPVNREEGHLIVAAIRILSHREGAPPQLEPIAELLDWPPESVRLKAAALVEQGILRRIDSAWQSHLEVGDHLKLEDLPAAETETGLDAELADFDRRKQAEADRIDRMFADGTLADEKRRKLDEMGEGLFDTPPDKPKNPFGDG